MLPKAKKHGSDGIAVITAISRATDPKLATEELKSVFA